MSLQLETKKKLPHLSAQSVPIVSWNPTLNPRLDWENRLYQVDFDDSLGGEIKLSVLEQIIFE